MGKSVPLLIFTALMLSEKPMSRKEICGLADIKPQLFDYWAKYLIETNVVFRDHRRYTVQKIFKDKCLIKLLNPFINKVYDNIHIEKNGNIEESISLNISLYMKYISNII